MYNRYIPQSDGTYRRSRVPEPQQHQRPHNPPPPKQKQEQREDCPPRHEEEILPCPPQQEHFPRCQEHRCDSVHGFLSQLLPKDFDTGDLIVVLLLLLLAGDCEEDRSTALLTLALYFIM